MRCTWTGCELEGVFRQHLKNGETFAVLCDAHRLELHAVLESRNRPAIQKAFLLAQGLLEPLPPHNPKQ